MKLGEFKCTLRHEPAAGVNTIPVASASLQNRQIPHPVTAQVRPSIPGNSISTTNYLEVVQDGTG